MVKYATKRLVFDEDKPLVFKLAVRYITKTKIGENPRVYIRPIGFSARVIKETYLRFGIPFGNPKAVIAHEHVAGSRQLYCARGYGESRRC